MYVTAQCPPSKDSLYVQINVSFWCPPSKISLSIHMQLSVRCPPWSGLFGVPQHSACPANWSRPIIEGLYGHDILVLYIIQLILGDHAKTVGKFMNDFFLVTRVCFLNPLTYWSIITEAHCLVVDKLKLQNEPFGVII